MFQRRLTEIKKTIFQFANASRSVSASAMANGIVKRLLMVFCFAALLIGGSTGIQGFNELESDVAKSFGLTDGEVVFIDVDRTPHRNVVTDVSIGGQTYTLDLNPISIRTPDFVLRIQQDDGTFENVQPEPSRLLKGTLRGVKGSRVVGSILDSGLAAKITMGDKQVFFVEPLASRLKDRNLENMHIVYRESDTKHHDCKCGVEDNAVGQMGLVQNPIAQKVTTTGDDGKQGNGYPEGGSPGLQIAEIGLDADFEYFTDYGSVAATTARMEFIIGLVNDQYESEVGITHMISGIVVRSTAADPYTSSDACILLDQMQAEWINNQGSIQRDVAHLFTGKEIDDSTIGLAFVGVVCSNSLGYGLAQSDFNGNVGCATDLSAHELGHNWNANHCSCPLHTMNAFITCANEFNPVTTIPVITSFRDSRTCLDGGGLPPANDDYFGPNLGLFPFNETGTNVDATTEPDEQQLEETGATVWWFFVAPADGTVTIDTFGSDFDTQLHIYTGFAMGFPNLIPVVNNDDTGGLQSQVAFAVSGGECYDVRVGGFEDVGPPAQGNIDLNGSFVPGMGVLLGDVNLDGFVNLLDVDPFVVLLSSGVFQAEADIDGNGVVNLLDVDPFVALLAGP